jgi:hypothetical protein
VQQSPVQIPVKGDVAGASGPGQKGPIQKGGTPGQVGGLFGGAFGGISIGGPKGINFGFGNGGFEASIGGKKGIHYFGSYVGGAWGSGFANPAQQGGKDVPAVEPTKSPEPETIEQGATSELPAVS